MAEHSKDVGLKYKVRPGTTEFDSAYEQKLAPLFSLRCIQQDVKYKVRPGTIDFGKAYEYKVAALFSLRCIQQDVEDMWLGTNVDIDVGPFDDIILKVKMRDHEAETFMIQVKHKSNPKPMLDQEFKADKGDLSLVRYISGITMFHSKFKKSYEFECLGPFDNVSFVLFINRGINESAFFKRNDNIPLASFLNTRNSNENIYRFDATNYSHSANDITNFYLLSNQVSALDMDEQITIEMKRIIGHLKFPQNYLRDISEKFVKFMSDWTQGHLGGYYFLTKKNILSILTELLLNTYMLNIEKETLFDDYTEQHAIWKQICDSQTVTLIQLDGIVRTFLIQYINIEIAQYCGKDVKTWNDDFSDSGKNRFYENYPELKDQMLKNFGSYGKISPINIYKCLWKMHQVPLLLQVDSYQDYKNILAILELSNYAYKVIILSSIEFPSIKQHKQQPFECLWNLNEEYVSKILTKEVLIQGRQGATLKDIASKNMLQNIKCQDIIHILSGTFNIGESLLLPEYFIERSIIKRFVKPEMLENDHALFVIDGDSEQLTKLASKHKCAISKLEEIDQSNLHGISGIIEIKGRVEPHLKKLQLSGKPIHILHLHINDDLEWRWTYGSSKIIECFQMELELSLENERINNLSSILNIISGDAGSGKSVLINYLAHQMPVNKFALKINASAHSSYWEESYRDPNTKYSEHLSYFYEAALSDKKNNPLHKLIFQRYVNLKNVVIFFDGFDEVMPSHRNNVINMIKSLEREGFEIWITTRPVMKTYLEEEFTVKSVTIKPFTALDQQQFLIRYFTTVNTDLNVPAKSDVEEFATKLLDVACKNLSSAAKFTEVPLQVRLLADVFNHDCREFIVAGDVNFNINFDILYLYQKFINDKINILIDRHGTSAQDLYVMLKQHHSLLAVKSVFSSSKLLEKWDAVSKVYDFYKNEPDRRQLLQRAGIVTIDDELNVCFVHSTFAEYLSAEWLAENLNSLDEQTKDIAFDLVRQRFSQKYNFLFSIFDRLLCRDCPLHWAILNKQTDQINELLESNADNVNKVDRGARSVLHISALNGFQYALPYESLLSKDTINADVMLETVKTILGSQVQIDQIDLMGYSPLDYALANCSLAIANEICMKLQNAVINIYINLDLKFDYFHYCGDYHPELFKILLPYFATRDLLLKNEHIHTNTDDYTRGLCTEFKGRTLLEFVQSEYGYHYSGYVKGDVSEYYLNLRYATAFGSENNVEKLLSDTDINKPDIDGCTPLHYAVLHGRPEIVEMLLLSGAEINRVNRRNDTPFLLAMRERNMKIIKLFLSQGAHPNADNEQGDNVLHALMQVIDIFQKEGMFKLITTVGANINMRGNQGETILIYAAKRNLNNHIIKFLQNGADINVQDNHGNAALHWSVVKGYLETTRLLCKEKAHVDITNRNGESPLHLAATKGLKDIISLLLAFGATIDLSSNNGNTPLHLASGKGHLGATKVLVSNGSDVNAENGNKNTPLHLASGNGHRNVTNFILHEGSVVNAANLDGDTALHLASLNGYTTTVKLLIASKANVRESNRNGDTPLHLAAQNGHTEVANLLVNSGADIDATNLDGNTSLLTASAKGHMGMVELLTSQGANVVVRNKNGDTPLHFAVQDANADLIHYFVNHGIDVNSINIDGNTPLHLASRQDHSDIAQLLISMGADSTIRNNNDNAAVHLAAVEGHTNTVIFLIRTETDIYTKDRDGNTPLHLVSKNGHLETVKLLVRYGADVHAQNALNNAPLHLASKNGHFNVVKFLISYGADIGIKNAYGDTPLHLASQNGFNGIVNFLLSCGADLNNVNAKGDTPLHLAAQTVHADVIKLLLAARANVGIKNCQGETPLHLAVASGCDEIISLIITNGANVNARDENDFTPLHYAVQNSNKDIMEKLIAHGGYVQAEDTTGSTALHIAAKHGNLDIIRYLLNCSVDTNKKAVDGNTPLHVASMRGYSDITKLLISKGADVNIKNEQGNSPLYLAINSHKQDIVSLLLSEGAKSDELDVNKKASLELAANMGDTNSLKLLLSSIIDNEKLQNLPHRKLPNFRFSVDHILAEKCPFHLAIIHGNLEEVESIVASGSNVLSMVDKAGRSVLHILANYGVQHSLTTFYKDNYKKFFEPIKDRMAYFTDEVLEYLGTDFQVNDILGYNPLDYALADGSLAVADKICTKLVDLPINIDLDDKKMYFTCCGIYEYDSLFNALVKYFASRDILCKHLNPTINSFVIRDCENAIFLIANGEPEVIKSFEAVMQRIQLYTERLDSKTILDMFQSENGTYEDLRFAVSFGKEENVEALLTTNWEIDKQDVDKNTALHYAATCNRSDATLQLLFQKGAHVNSQGRYGNTPLHYAAKNEGSEVLSILLIHGADVNIKNTFGETPLHVAAKNGLTEIGKILLESSANINETDKYGRSPIHYAADKNHKQFLKLLLSKNASIDQQDHAENTALIYAARSRHEECLQMLVSKNADVTKQGFLGRTALHWAAYYCSDDIVSVLLRHNESISVDIHDNSGNTALHYAIKTCNRKLVDLLLLAGANVNEQNNQNETVLHCACNRYNVLDDDEDDDNSFDPCQHEEIVKDLLHRADANLQEYNGNTALHCAILTIYKIKSYFQENDCEDEEDYVSASKCYKNIVCALLDNKTNINIQNGEKSTALHLAIKYGDSETTKLLLSKQAAIDIEDENGNFPIHLAAQKGCSDIVSEILIHKGSVNVKNQNGDTPLDLAIKNKHLETAKLLQSAQLE